LHARPFDPAATCSAPLADGLDCAQQRPVVTCDSLSHVDIYVFAKNFESMRGLQVKFMWPANWVFEGWFGSCQPGSITVVSPVGVERNLSLAFECTGNGVTLQPIGWLRMWTGPNGCLDVIQSDYPYASHLLSCAGLITSLGNGHCGRICVGAGGVDRCDPPPAGEWDSMIIEY